MTQDRKCFFCGENNPLVLEEHHLVPRKFKKQIADTMTLCSNCHKKLHYSLRLLEQITRGEEVEQMPKKAKIDDHTKTISFPLERFWDLPKGYFLTRKMINVYSGNRKYRMGPYWYLCKYIGPPSGKHKYRFLGATEEAAGKHRLKKKTKILTMEEAFVQAVKLANKIQIESEKQDV